MKRKHSGYILAATFISLCSFLLHIVLITTNHWVGGDAVSEFRGTNVTNIHYGLFTGSLTQTQENSSVSTFTLTLVCLLDTNVCAWTCQTTDVLRREDVLTLYETGQILYGCINVQSQTQAPARGPFKPLWEVRASFITGLAWLTTVVSVSISQFLCLIALSLTAYNINHIPSNDWVSIRSLYFWYGSSGISAVLTLSVWGCEYFFKLEENIGIVDTIGGIVTSTGKSYLGYSYWCLLGVVGLQCCCGALMYYREKLFDQRPLFVCPLVIQSNTIASLRLS